MNERMISIRRLSKAGSTAVDYVISEAEQIASAAWARGALVVDTDMNEPITKIAPDTRNLLVVDPIQGG